MMEVGMSEPLGVVGVYTNPQGDVVVSVSDFKEQAPGGYTLYEAQRERCKRKLSVAVVNAYCSTVVCEALDDYDCGQIVRKLKGKITFIPINHPDSD